MLVLFAELNYRLVESPLRRRGARIAERYERAALQDLKVAESPADGVEIDEDGVAEDETDEGSR